MTRKFIFADPMTCTGCRICELVCAFDRYRVLNPMKARLRVVREPLGWDYVKACRQCEDPDCAEECPEEALYQDEDGILHFDSEHCTECLACIDACPYNAIFENEETGHPLRCDLCKGRAKEPLCKTWCPPKAIDLYLLEDVEEILKGKPTTFDQMLSRTKLGVKEQ